ncbi:GSCOCG00000722001-RA-CDS, partial [Cotesia congregata]
MLHIFSIMYIYIYIYMYRVLVLQRQKEGTSSVSVGWFPQMELVSLPEIRSVGWDAVEKRHNSDRIWRQSTGASAFRAKCPSCIICPSTHHESKIPPPAELERSLRGGDTTQSPSSQTLRRLRRISIVFVSHSQ